MKRPSMQIGLGIALGAGIGAAVAVIIGTGGAWLAVGIAIGVLIGAAMARKKAAGENSRFSQNEGEVGHPRFFTEG
jgi:Arc/MetJ family transcription regulator